MDLRMEQWHKDVPYMDLRMDTLLLAPALSGYHPSLDTLIVAPALSGYHPSLDIKKGAEAPLNGGSPKRSDMTGFSI